MRRLPLLAILGAALTLDGIRHGVAADEFQPPRFVVPKQDVKKDDIKKAAHDTLPITRYWDTKELQKLGKILQTRNEAASKNRVVWTLEVTEVPKDPGLKVSYFDDEQGRLYTEETLQYLVLKDEKEKGKVRRMEVILKLPPKEIQVQTHTAVFQK